MGIVEYSKYLSEYRTNNIFKLMDVIDELKCSVILAIKDFQNGDRMYWVWEFKAEAVISALIEIGYTDSTARDQLYHILRVGKRTKMHFNYQF